MTVRLVSYTQPAPEFKNLGIDDAQELVAFCARVSNPDNQLNTETSKRLINYLIKHAHWSPLEMCDATLEVTTYRDISRQMIRHRAGFYQEFSQRYSNPVDSLGFGIREARLQDNKNRQNSIKAQNEVLQAEWARRQNEILDLVSKHYHWAIENGIAKECARVILPEGNTYSRMYIKNSIRGWIHYLELRTGNGTQLEHMEIAREMAVAISSIFPMVTDYIGENND